MTSVILKKGQTTTAFKVTGLAKGDKVKSYRSSNTKIASVDSRGKIKGIRIGSTRITVTLASGKKATVKVKVQKNAVATQKLTVSPSRISLKLKKTYKLKISRSPLTTVERITYRSSNSKVASVNSKGVITARKKGTRDDYRSLRQKEGHCKNNCKIVQNTRSVSDFSYRTGAFP